MKKLICLCALSFLSAQAMAVGAACAGTAGQVTITGGTAFIKTTFSTTCSNNVKVDWDENDLAAWGASGSNKGACYQIGHTDAGVRAKTPTCGAAAKEIPSDGASPTAADAEDMASS